jgi:hypothetical protein
MVRKDLQICPGVEGNCGGKPHLIERGANESRIKEDQGLRRGTGIKEDHEVVFAHHVPQGFCRF